MRACGYSCFLDQGTVEALLGRYDGVLGSMMTFCRYDDFLVGTMTFW